MKIATRESFGLALCELAKTHPEIVVLDADLAAATKTDIFKKAYPERFFDCGIAEGNMIGVAAGLAACGKVPFAASFAMFATGRAYEQIRNSVGYPHLNVKIAGSHAGITVGEDGATHQCCEDLALMRTIPGMVVLNPADHYEMTEAVKAALAYNGPVYIRLGRLAIDTFNNPDTYQFELGKGINARLINMHTIKPIDKDIIIKAAKETGKIITVEEHNIIGGLGEAVCAVMSEFCPVPVKRIGVEDTYGHSGPALGLLAEFGLDAEGLEKRIIEIVK